MRELLILLAEVRFKHVPQLVVDAVLTMLEGWGSTLVNELGSKAYRKRRKVCENSKLGSVETWHSLAASDVMTGLKRDTVDFGQEGIRGERVGLPKSFFETSACKASSPDLNKITEKLEHPTF